MGRFDVRPSEWRVVVVSSKPLARHPPWYTSARRLMGVPTRSPERRAGSRGEFLDLPRLQVAARELASLLFPLDPKTSRWQSSRHLHRLDRQAAALAAVYRTVADDVHRGETISPAAEWLLDNFHLIANEVRDRPPRSAAAATTAGCPSWPPGGGSSRVGQAMADELIRHSDGRFDAERLRGFVQAFQTVSPADDRRALGLAERAQGGADRERGGCSPRAFGAAATRARAPTRIWRRWTRPTSPRTAEAPISDSDQPVVHRSAAAAHPRVRAARSPAVRTRHRSAGWRSGR